MNFTRLSIDTFVSPPFKLTNVLTWQKHGSENNRVFTREREREREKRVSIFVRETNIERKRISLKLPCSLWSQSCCAMQQQQLPWCLNLEIKATNGYNHSFKNRTGRSDWELGSNSVWLKPPKPVNNRTKTEVEPEIFLKTDWCPVRFLKPWI